MHMNLAAIVVLLIVGLIVVASKIWSTRIVLRHPAAPWPLRAAFIVRTLLVIVVFATGLDHYCFPVSWRLPISVYFKLLLFLVGIWAALAIISPVFLWKQRNDSKRKQIGVKIL